VNAIVTHDLQWRGAIPTACIAAYVLEREKLRDGLRLLQNETVLDEPERASFDGVDWARHFAALHLNVDPSEAYEALLDQPIERALFAGNDGELTTLARSTGFIPVW
jgi:hypothetical protein